jgi:hypothetical protein
MMLCGHVVPKFLLGRVLGLMRNHWCFEHWQLLTPLEASKALDHLQQADNGSVQRHSAFCHGVNLRQT